ncbi:MAG: hypothetical protein QMD22_10010 [archaeon]|nr:hypothetical protein [archaeon]
MNKVCMFCGVEMRPVIASYCDIYESAAVYDDPRASIKMATGDTYCPKCMGGNCGVSIPLTQKDIENLRQWFKHNPQDLERCIPAIQEIFLEK